MIGFPFDKKISIYRVPYSTSINDRSYEGRQPPFTLIFQDLPCTIQLASQTSKPDTNLPQDLSNNTYWDIILWGIYPEEGSILERDIAIDGKGKKYEIVGADWERLGYWLLAKLLTT